ncbi:probable SUP35-eukaryotic peptide chain release factor GTP-binding subunit [Serendipita indica DSM 11827]|uniref:Eukaryotic peptide chain release factor GTP-binding subunit n=1 Tax=Serendipita indica (strain DSM 11827) TaxID=1109443 RepID=G4TFR1_SERID|nr:probable SUP35-eukaryotic peptide chain release factor GTP-binding subunit [Serendipita indica DSM 11827]
MSRLNAGAFEFVPGQSFRPPQQGQGQQGPPGSQQPPVQPGYGFQNNFQGNFQPPQGAYGQQQQQYGQGYYQQPGQGYPNQYGNAYPYYQQYNQQQPYRPPQHLQQDFQPPAQQYQSQPPTVPNPTPAQEPPRQSAPAPAPTGVTVSLNIGGSKPAAAATPKENKADAPSSGHASGTSTPTKPPPKSQTSVPKAGAAPAAKEKKEKDFNFSMDRAKNDADAIVKEQTAIATEETLKELYGAEEEDVVDTNEKVNLNVVFTGHVDAGKSTLGGQILVLTGNVDKRTLEKNMKDAKDAGRETWYLSWALDSTPQERDKGKTVEVGRAYFETDKKRYTILDAPGHNTFVPSMISGAAQADISVLVISARKGEFETGFEKGGQTREHITLVRTAGVNKIVVVINKMDDPTVEWDKARFDEIKDKLSPFARATGYNPKTDLVFIPVSAYTGVNVKDRADKQTLPWYNGPSLLEYLDNLPPPDRKLKGPVMIPVSEKYKDMGTVIVGKIESGRVRKGSSLLMMPNRVTVEVAGIFNEMEEEIASAFAGDNVRIRLRGVDDEDISPGFVLTSPNKPVHTVRQFIAQLAILEHKSIICAGYSAVMHVHTLSEEVNLLELLHYLDKKAGKRSKKPPQFAKKGMQIIAKVETTAPICLETYKDYPQLGRFTLRDEGKTIAMGKVLKLIEASDATD